MHAWRPTDCWESSSRPMWKVATDICKRKGTIILAWNKFDKILVQDHPATFLVHNFTKFNNYCKFGNKYSKFIDMIMSMNYSIVKDSSADLGISRLSKIDPQLRLSAPKFQIFFCIFVNIFVFLRENKEVPFFIFWIFKLKQP